MVNKNYAKGYRFEVRVKKHLESKGWTVFRQGKSAFPDLIAIKNGNVILVECKNHKRFNLQKPFASLMSEEERTRALDLIKNTKVAFILAYNYKTRIHWLDIGGFDIFRTMELWEND